MIDALQSLLAPITLTHWAIAALVLIGLANLYARRPRVAGTIRVRDGDSVEIDGVDCRLYGIDAPEMPSIPGRRARQALENLLAVARVDGGKVRYRVVGNCFYGRPLVRLYGAFMRDINADMVGEGYAVHYGRYSRRYALLEMKARIARRGLWRDGHLHKPEAERRARRYA